MTAAYIIPILAIITIAAVIVFAMVSRKKTIERMEDPEAEKSTLAADAPDSRS